MDKNAAPRRVFYVSAKDNTDLSVTRARFMTNLQDDYLWKHRAMDEKSFYINDDEFLTTASQPPESFIKVKIEVSLFYLRHYSYPWGQDPAFLCHVRSNISWCG